MKRSTIVLISLFGIAALTTLPWSGSASATSSKGRPYLEATRGVVVSTTPNQITTSGIVRGTPIAYGRSSGTSASSGPPPPCSSGTAPGSGSNTTAAQSGGLVFLSYTGSVCLSSSTTVSGTYSFTGTFTINGGTGRFAGATGGGTLAASFTLYARPQGSQGPLVSHARGRIFLLS